MSESTVVEGSELAERTAGSERGVAVMAPTTLRVSRTVTISPDYEDTDRAESSEVDEVIEVHRFPEGVAPAYASVSVPVKKTKDYNSAGITIGVQIPCYAEEMPQALEKAYGLVKERLMVELPKIIRALDDISRV
jgi:hypothetical protein